MLISHVGIMDVNEVEKILNWTDLTKSSEYTITQDKEIRDDVDVIVFGVCDGGDRLDVKLDDIIAANKAGIGLVFTHDFPNIMEYDPKYADIGIIGMDHSYDYNMFDLVRIASPLHPIINTFYDISKSSLVVQRTHNTGITLSNECIIVLDDPNIPASNKNYYLACLDVLGKGRIAHMSLGHNSYRRDDLITISKEESNILANTILWAAEV